MKKDVFTIPEIAKMLKLSRQTVYHWVVDGSLTAFRPSKNAVWKVTRRELIKYMREHSIPMEFFSGGTIRILIVDDEVNIVRAIQRAFKNNDSFTMESAHSGFIAGTKLENFRPDVVILDIYLNDMDGREFLKYIRSNAELNGIKVIGISGKMPESEIHLMLEQGFDAFLSKPFAMEKLRETIMEVVGE